MKDIFEKDFEQKLTAIYDSNYAKLNGSKPAAKSITQRYPTGEVTVKLIPIKVTIYKQGEMFGGAPRGIEATAFNFAIAPYAQYQRALHVYYIPKGKRNVRHFVDSYEPTTMIVEGWNHPKEAGATFHPTEHAGGGLALTRSRYLSHDKKYATEAKDFMNSYLKAVKANVIVDFRA